MDKVLSVKVFHETTHAVTTKAGVDKFVTIVQPTISNSDPIELWHDKPLDTSKDVIIIESWSYNNAIKHGVYGANRKDK